jgi:hypothetical protein
MYQQCLLYLSVLLLSPKISYSDSFLNTTDYMSYDLTNTIIKGDSLKQVCQDTFQTLSIFDLFFFGVIVVVVFEVLSFVTGQLGRKFDSTLFLIMNSSQ